MQRDGRKFIKEATIWRVSVATLSRSTMTIGFWLSNALMPASISINHDLHVPSKKQIMTFMCNMYSANKFGNKNLDAPLIF